MSFTFDAAQVATLDSLIGQGGKSCQKLWTPTTRELRFYHIPVEVNDDPDDRLRVFN